MKTKTGPVFILVSLLAWARAGNAQTTHSNNLWLGIQNQAATVLLTVHTPSNGTPFTNQVEIYRSTNLVSDRWEIAALGLSPRTNQPALWTNDHAGTVAFYAAGNTGVDTDGDTLPNARETYVYGTSPATNNTDGDSVNDGLEIQRMTDPLNSNDFNRIIYVANAPPGNNSNDGYDSILSNGHGPKRNIRDGLQLALNGDSVQVVDNGNYIETNWTINGRVTLLINQPTTIKNP